MGCLDQGDHLAAAQHECDGEHERAEPDQAGEHDGRAADDETGRVTPSARGSLDAVARAGEEAGAGFAPLGHECADKQREGEDQDGSRIACQSSAPGSEFAEVSAMTATRAREDSRALSETPVTHASAREARTPERAAKIAVKDANARGASESTKDAAPGSMPAAAR